MSNIFMVGDDGSVYQVDSGDLGKIAKKVDHEKLSGDAQAHIKEHSQAAKSGAVAHIFAARSDIFVASKSDIFVASKSDIFVSGKDE